MAKENKQPKKRGEVIVKNKKFKRSDILAFGICVMVALVIWIYATNVELKNNTNPEGGTGEVESSEQV